MPDTPPKPSSPPAATWPAASVLQATLVSGLLPGLGQLRLGARRLGALLLAATLAAAGLAAWHLTAGLPLFESALGAFSFRALLRGLALLYGFAALDSYLRGVDPPDHPGHRRRLAVLLNLLVPGLGYLFVRAWVRTATGLALLVLVLVFAHAGTNRYIDLIYVAMQLIMGAAVYQHQLLQAGRRPRRLPTADRTLQLAQVVVLITLVLALAAGGYLLVRSLPGAGLVNIRPEQIRVEPTKEGLHFAVPQLGLRLTAVGPGWQQTDHPSILFGAENAGEAFLRLTRQPLPPFVRQERYLELLQAQLEEQGLVLERTLALKVDGQPAVQLRFSGDKTESYQGDHWVVAVPQDGFAYVLMLYCRRGSCEALAPLLERSRDSLTLPR